MIDVAAVNLDYPTIHDPILQPQYTFAQPNPASFGGFDLTGEQSIEVARPFQSTIFDINNLLAMTFHQQFPLFPQIFQLSDQDLTTNSPNNNTSTPQQQPQQKNPNEMTAATAFTNQHQQYVEVDNSPQQTTTMLQTSPPFVEPSINYPCYPNTSSSSNTTTASNPVILNNNLDNHVTNNYSSRSVYIGNYSQQQQQYLDNYHNCPTTHPPRIGMTNPQLINYPNNCLRQRMIYQGPSPVSTASVGRQHHQKQIQGTIGSNISYTHPDNVTSTSLPTSSIASNTLFTFNPSTNASTMLVPSVFEHSSTIFTSKPTPQTTITIPNSTGTSTSSSENTSPTKQSYSYSGPPKSYYSRLPLYDRPFKCDTCPQSFNRNHDLKRHKRIHLAVKPYPCPYCEKQFSRKDALKRHILVKGCNNNNNNNTSNNKRSVNNNTDKNVDDSSNSLGQKYDSPIKSESPIKTEPTNDNIHQYI